MKAKLYPMEKDVQAAFAAGWAAAVRRYLGVRNIPSPGAVSLAWDEYRDGLTPTICGVQRPGPLASTLTCEREPGHTGNHWHARRFYWAEGAPEFGDVRDAIGHYDEEAMPL